MKKLSMVLVVFLAMIMAGCATVPSQKEIAQRGAEIMDNALDIAIWEMCYAASIGSLRREFGTNQDRIRAWQMLCGEIGLPISPIPLDPILEELNTNITR